MAESSQSDFTQFDDAALLAAMLVGSEQAFIALYRRRQAGLYRFALRMTGSHTAAEDAVQETFLVLMRSAASFDAARGSVSSFLYGIARNCVRRGWERDGALLAVSDDEMEARIEAQKNASGPYVLAAQVPRPDESYSQAEEVEALRRAILALPEHYRAVVVLCDLEELNYEDVAAALGCALGTVRSRLHRARALLGERLKFLASEGGLAAEEKPQAGGPGTRVIPPMECKA
jgi:RNA polymerase sigma-70 factor (ECF subfamily)